MSTDYSVIGIIPPDEKWEKMKAIVDACEAANIGWPVECERFFNGERPDPKGVLVDLNVDEENTEEGTTVFDVELANLPKDVTIIRFQISY